MSKTLKPFGKYILIGDVHIDKFKDTDVHHKNFSLLLNNHINTTMREHGIDTMIFMGDIFDNRTSLNIKSVTFMLKEIGLYLTNNPDHKMIMITGNHDVYYKDTNKVSSLDLFVHDNITVIDEPVEIGNILFVPWVNKENTDYVMELVRNTKMEYCLGHFEFAGFKQHPNDKLLSKGRSVTDFRHFKKVISGHIHYSSEDGNILYTGSSLQFDKSDAKDVKKLFILDTQNHTIEKFEHDVILCHDVIIDKNDAQMKLPDLTSKRVYVKIALGISENNYDKTLDRIREMKPLSLDVYDNPNIRMVTNGNIQIDDIEDTPTIIKNYVASLEIPELNLQRLESELLDYYVKSQVIIDE